MSETIKNLTLDVVGIGAVSSGIGLIGIGKPLEGALISAIGFVAVWSKYYFRKTSKR